MLCVFLQYYILSCIMVWFSSIFFTYFGYYIFNFIFLCGMYLILNYGWWDGRREGCFDSINVYSMDCLLCMSINTAQTGSLCYIKETLIIRNGIRSGIGIPSYRRKVQDWNPFLQMNLMLKLNPMVHFPVQRFWHEMHLLFLCFSAMIL